jgi:hypothetical protein
MLLKVSSLIGANILDLMIVDVEELRFSLRLVGGKSIAFLFNT